MLRLLHTADVHLGLTKFGGAYDASQDQASMLYAFSDAAIAHKVDVAIIAGDLFHTRRPTPPQLYAAVTAIGRMSRADVQVLIAGGNHDGPANTASDETGTHTLDWMQALKLANVHVFTANEGGGMLTPSGKPYYLVTVPYPHKRRWDAELHDLPVDERVQEASSRLAWTVDALAERINHDVPAIFLGHLTVEGAVTGTEREMQLGWDTTLPARCLEPFDYAALGHIHRQQNVAERAWYAGSPAYVSFSEEGDPKSFLRVDITDLGNVIEQIPTGARPIKTYVEGEEVPLGAILRLHVPHDIDPVGLQNRLRTLRESGAVYIDIIFDRPEQAARVDLTETFDLRQLLSEYLTQRRLPLEPYLSTAQEIVDADV